MHGICGTQTVYDFITNIVTPRDGVTEKYIWRLFQLIWHIEVACYGNNKEVFWEIPGAKYGTPHIWIFELSLRLLPLFYLFLLYMGQFLIWITFSLLCQD